MKVIIFGASGMVGGGVLLECISDSDVSSILVVGRTPSGIDDPTLTEMIHQDFFDYSSVEDGLIGFDACFFCLGVSAAGMTEEKYRHLTYDLTIAAAETLARLNPDMTFCYVSGQGTDSTEKGRIMWARIKGATENRLLEMPFAAAFMFRPGYIQPMKGIRSKTRLYQSLYTALSWLYPVLEKVMPNGVTTTEKLGRAMIAVGLRAYSKPVLATRDINELAGNGDDSG
jgi:uncharacterized protein YbjT (DUF2867 family)